MNTRNNAVNPEVAINPTYEVSLRYIVCESPPGITDGLHAPLGNAVNELRLKYHHGFSLARNTTHSSNDTGGPIAMMSSDNPPGCAYPSKLYPESFPKLKYIN